MTSSPRQRSREERLKAHQRGARAETWVALFLMLKGYRVLARRFKTPVGEIDIIARRGRRIAFIEVKRRPSFELCEASITGQARQRIRRAAALWMGKNERYQEFDQGFDLVFLAGWHAPRHLLNAI